MAIARTIADGPTAAFGGIKALLFSGDRTTLADHLDAEAAAISAAMATDDAAEGVAAFLERRKPTFKGK